MLHRQLSETVSKQWTAQITSHAPPILAVGPRSTCITALFPCVEAAASCMTLYREQEWSAFLKSSDPT